MKKQSKDKKTAAFKAVKLTDEGRVKQYWRAILGRWEEEKYQQVEEMLITARRGHMTEEEWEREEIGKKIKRKIETKG